jgi:hypothetical protein
VDQDRFEPIVPSGASGGPQAQFAKPNGSIIHDHQNFRLIDPMVTGVICDCLAAQVHEGLWFHEKAAAKQCHLGIPLRFKAERDRSAASKLLGNQKPDVVPGANELSTWIPEPNDETKDGSMLHAREPGSLLLRLRGRFWLLGLLFLENLRRDRFFGRDDRLLRDSGFRDQKHGQLFVGHGCYPRRKLDIANMKGVAYIQTRDIDHDDFGQILGQASNRKQAHALLQQTAKGLHSDRFSLGLKDHFCIDLFVHRNSVKVYVDDLAADRMVLDLLNEGKSTGGFLSIVDLQLYQDVFAYGACENVFNIPLVDFEIGGDIFAPVDHCGNRAARPHPANCVAPRFIAGTGGEFNLIGHDYFLGFLISKSELTDSSS